MDWYKFINDHPTQGTIVAVAFMLLIGFIFWVINKL